MTEEHPGGAGPPLLFLLVKPAGPDCNLRCAYCFYRPTAELFPDAPARRMDDARLGRLIEQACGLGRPQVVFGWQGGEPTLCGLDFFQRSVALQARHRRPGQVLANTLQTNATQIDRRWARFLAEQRFLVGVSLDGPEAQHDRYRRDAAGQGSYARVRRGLDRLLEAGAQVNLLTLLHAGNVGAPERLYDFLLQTGVRHLQFVPCLEAGPDGGPAPFAISAEAYGEFLVRLFDRWLDSSLEVSVRLFDDLWALMRGEPAKSCIWAARCGDYLLVERSGDVFPCDFYVRPEWKLGNLFETPLPQIERSERLRAFRQRKAALGERCRRCEWLAFCHGGCPRHRTVLGGDLHEPSQFCAAYRRLFEHAAAALLEICGDGA